MESNTTGGVNQDPKFGPLPNPYSMQPPHTTAEEASRRLFTAVESSFSSANPLWKAEYANCLIIAAMENQYMDVDDVNAVFERRGSGLDTKTRSASGAIFLAAVRKRVLEKANRPEGRPLKSNSNRPGTRFYKSMIHVPGLKVDSKYDANDPVPRMIPVQEVLDFWNDPVFQRESPETFLEKAFKKFNQLN